MKSECAQYKDMMLEAALSGTSTGALAEHLRQCGDCEGEFIALQARREKMDALLPLMAGEAEPGPGFRARVLAAAEAAGERKSAWPGRFWILAGAMAALAVIVLADLIVQRRVARNVEQANDRTMPATQLVAAQRLAEWRAPSDVLLQTPGQELLRTTPKFGESYLSSPQESVEEK
jgi:hypothetical protein